METRPASVTVISWILVAIGALSLIGIVLMLNNPGSRQLMMGSPVPVSVHFVIMSAGLLVTLVSGVGMLKGKNWARLLYVTWTPLRLVFRATTSPIKLPLILGLVVYLVFVFFLFSSKSNHYFRTSEVESSSETGSGAESQ